MLHWGCELFFCDSCIAVNVKHRNIFNKNSLKKRSLKVGAEETTERCSLCTSGSTRGIYTYIVCSKCSTHLCIGVSLDRKSDIFANIEWL